MTDAEITLEPEGLEAAKAAFYGRHEAGFIMEPLIDPPDLEGAIRAYLSRSTLPREGQGEVGEPDWYMDPDDRICLRPSEVTPDDNWVPLYAAPLSPSPAVRDGVVEALREALRQIAEVGTRESVNRVGDMYASDGYETSTEVSEEAEIALRSLSTQEQGNG